MSVAQGVKALESQFNKLAVMSENKSKPCTINCDFTDLDKFSTAVNEILKDKKLMISSFKITDNVIRLNCKPSTKYYRITTGRENIHNGKNKQVSEVQKVELNSDYCIKSYTNHIEVNKFDKETRKYKSLIYICCTSEFIQFIETK